LTFLCIQAADEEAKRKAAAEAEAKRKAAAEAEEKRKAAAEKAADDAEAKRMAAAEKAAAEPGKPCFMLALTTIKSRDNHHKKAKVFRNSISTGSRSLY